MRNNLMPVWLRGYRRDTLAGDLVAALVVTMLLVPQGLAYASLAGLPPQLGLYASLLPLAVYGLFGSSMVMSVGPVAVASLMTASALAPLAEPGSPEWIAGAVVLALLAGLMLFLFGMLRLGALARFLSHPVISGFISGAALLIVISQLRPLLGIHAEGEDAFSMVTRLVARLGEAQPLTAAIGGATLVALWLARARLAALLRKAGLPEQPAALLSKLAPMAAVLVSAALTAHLGWADRIEVVGELPAGLPELVLPRFEPGLISALWLPALLIGLIGFVESVSIAQAFARRRGQRIDADAELRGLGAANIASALSGAFPVTGGFSRTAVNADAGARTPLAGIIAAAMIALVLLFGTGLFRSLPVAVLAATIIVAALALVDLRGLRDTWRYDRAEGIAAAGTALGVLLAGVEAGIATGIVLSLASLVWRASQPHIAEVGRVPGSEHFRNVCRHVVETRPELLMLRVDENLFFGNADVVEEHVLRALGNHPDARHLVLVMSSVSGIDATAVEMLERLNKLLAERGVSLHLAEVKGPVRDRLQGSDLPAVLTGKIWLSTQCAFTALAAPDPQG